MSLFEGYERRIDKINGVLKEYGISSVEECKDICLAKGVDCDTIVRGTQPICFENAVWAYTVGAAIAIKKGCKKAADAAAAIGIGLQAFCIPGSVAQNTATWALCFFPMRPNVSASLRDTNPSRPRKVRFLSLKTQTKSERTP